MRFLVRLRNLLSARAHALLDRFEDPECLATQALRELEDKLDVLRQQAAMAVAVERRLPEPIGWRVSTFTLVASETSGAVPVYRTVAQWPLVSF